ncbi:hypothetical protein PVK06_004727 [Gossypium arboreum]|uniref:RNase H type-1 domain-containing protein n=1 Tax=Gossypium arboreum TaxID=29729 RepID=A0ABR0QU26_GOSAR|nr:hypothetical protein PVK06_004727 [Gossypium arboreum]
MLPSQPIGRKWINPPCGVVKINVDAAIEEGKMGLSVIVKDKDGFLLGRYGYVKDMTFNSEWAEIMAIEEDVSLAKKFEFKKGEYSTLGWQTPFKPLTYTTRLGNFLKSDSPLGVRCPLVVLVVCLSTILYLNGSALLSSCPRIFKSYPLW